MARDKFFIDGKWRYACGDGAITVLNPSTEEVLAKVPDGSVTDIDWAVSAARRAFDEGPWPRMRPAERSRYLMHMVEGLERRREELVELAIAEVGVPRRMAQLPVEQFAWMAERAETFEFATELASEGGTPAGFRGSRVLKEAVGVVAGFTPFNAPLRLALWKVGAALAMGNTVVLKPSPYTPLDALIVAEVSEEAGVPPGVLNVVVGGSELGHRLVIDPRVDVVSFTGSDAVGRQILSTAAGSMKKVVLECGGKSPILIFADCDLDQAVPAALYGFTLMAGQGCALTTRILVERSIHAEFLDMISHAAAELRVGDATDPAVDMGPLIRESQRSRVEGYIEGGKREGALVVFGGGRPSGLSKGFFVEPTIFANVTNNMAISREEIFGPVASVISFDGADEATSLANDSPYGLAAAVWTRSEDRGYELARNLRAGTVQINGNIALRSDAPFGGFKCSGVGRELGDYGLMELVELKTVNWSSA